MSRLLEAPALDIREMGIWHSKLSPQELSYLQTVTHCKLSQQTLPVLFHLLTARQLRDRSFRNSKGISRDTLFTSQKPCCSYKLFIKECPSGQLNKAGFRQRFRNASPLSDPGEFSDHLFDVYDGDRNGKIDFREFICTQSIMSDDSPEKKLERTPRSINRAHPINFFCS